MSLLNYLFHTHIRSKLPRLKKTLINQGERVQGNDDTQRLMTAGVARDEFAALDLLERHELPLDKLIRLLTKPRRADWRKRLINRLRTLEGSYPHDPHGPELRALKRGERTGRNNWM